MDSKPPETAQLRSTFHPYQQTVPRRPAPQPGGSRPEVKHALVVVNRMLRSSANPDDSVKGRVIKAAGALRTAAPTPTAFVSGRAVDVAMRIAVRLARRVGF